MKFELIADPVEFERRTRVVVADEARHNLLRGILGNIIADRTTYEDFQMFLVSQGAEVVAAALMTKPYNLILADVNEATVVSELVAGLVASGITIPGVIGNRPTVDRFVVVWEETTCQPASLTMEQGVFALDEVVPPHPVPGRARQANDADLDVVFRWLTEFFEEALPDEPRDDAALRASLERRLGGDGPSAVWLWDREGAPMSMSSHASPTGSGIRISAVYTPPRLRGSGYASALVAAQSEWLLHNGYTFCFLFTDLENPTSNAIYERIGYRQIAEGASYTFG